MDKFKEDNYKIPVYNWCDKIEENTMKQINNLAKLPFAFHHIVLSPDGHLGYGMPIGGVMATKNVIVPNAVGVDIGAVDKETEVLTKEGWKSIAEYQEEDVLVWDNFKQTSFFSKPLLYIIKPCENFTEYKNKYGLDQVLSDEHRMLVYQGYRENKKDNTYFCKDFRKHLLKIKKQDYYSIRTTFPTNESGVNLTNEQLAIRVMVSADGHIREARENYTLIELHFKKTRKIVRSKKLLKQAKIDFKEHQNKDKTVSIVFKLNWVCDKNLTDLFSCNQSQAKIIFDEYLYWDGTIDKKRNHKNYSSVEKKNADVIQYICALNNVRAGIYRSISEKKKWRDCYQVYQTQNAYVGFSKPKKVKKIGANKYCFVVKTGYFIARRNGNIFITGNCGMCAVKTSLTEIDTDTLKKIMGEIRKVVPVGFKKHNEKQDENLMPQRSFRETVEREEYLPIIDKEYDNALKSLGTLGGGNHFIEIQKGNDGHIWIMIHSGSRNLGLQVANHYNKLAVELNEKYYSQVPKKWELAFLSMDDEEGLAYRAEMEYCVEYALANRLLMMDRIMEIFKKESYGQFGMLGEITNIAHNYASLENHFGQNVYVHRKGATQAKKGQIGIIPGSQGSSSYIVEGLGNVESFTSCSHGAGRKMGRKQAERELDLKEEIKILDDRNIIHGIRHKSDLDEATSCYKNIDKVMESQKDLVKILVKLSPLAVIKG